MSSKNTADKIKAIAREDATRFQTLAQDAVRSRAYLYPIKGIAYFLSHRSLWKPLTAKLAPILTTGIGVTTFMFIFAYLPQAAVLAIFNGPLAAISTILLTLSESSTITNIISRSFFIQDALVDTFDGTLVSRGKTTLVSEDRQIKSGADPIARLGKAFTKPFQKFAPSNIIRYFMYMPLNFIPVVGTVIFVFMQGKKFGPSAHARYFQLKQMKSKEKEDFVKKRQAAYTSFGTAAVLFELIPFVGVFFAFTNTVGAALWAADMEETNNTSPELRDLANKAD